MSKGGADADGVCFFLFPISDCPTSILLCALSLTSFSLFLPNTNPRLRLSRLLDHLFIAPEDGTAKCTAGVDLDQVAVIVVGSVFAVGVLCFFVFILPKTRRALRRDQAWEDGEDQFEPAQTYQPMPVIGQETSPRRMHENSWA